MGIEELNSGIALQIALHSLQIAFFLYANTCDTIVLLIKYYSEIYVIQHFVIHSTRLISVLDDNTDFPAVNQRNSSSHLGILLW